MTDEINISIVPETIEIQITGSASWDSIVGKPMPAAESSFIVSNSAMAWVVKTLAQVKAILGLGSAAYVNTGTFATAAHNQSQITIAADPFVVVPGNKGSLVVDCAIHKDYKYTGVWGDSSFTISGAVDGDAGMLEIIVDAIGGYTLTFGASFTKKIGTGVISNVANADNVISWRKVNNDIIYTIAQVE